MVNITLLSVVCDVCICIIHANNSAEYGSSEIYLWQDSYILCNSLKCIFSP